eukprot:6207686-Pleurochrysis_carterae.AAC.1
MPLSWQCRSAERTCSSMSSHFGAKRCVQGHVLVCERESKRQRSRESTSKVRYAIERQRAQARAEGVGRRAEEKRRKAQRGVDQERSA